MASRISTLVLLLLLTVAALLAAPSTALATPPAAAQQSYKPLTLEQTVQLLQGGLTSKRVVQLIDERGVDYRLDATTINRLSAAGADTSVQAAVAVNYRGSQPAVTVPPAPASNASLADTLNFIQQKLVEQPTINFTSSSHDTDNKVADWTVNFSTEYTRVSADPGQCRLNFHVKVFKNTTVTSEQDLWIPFHDVTDVTIRTAADELKEGNTNSGHTSWVTTVTPQVFEVVALRAGNKQNFVDFYDQQLAVRVARAMSHAAQLCGGGSKDPF